ncbi:MAG: phage tail protein [Pseudomonadota bacterium]
MSDQSYLRGYNFKLQVGLDVCAYFTSICDFGTEIDVVEHRAGGDANNVITLPGLVRHSRIKLSWGVTAANSDMWDWLCAAIDCRDDPENPVKRDVGIICLAADGITPTLRYDLGGAWPCSWSGWRFDASSSEAAIEHVTLAVDTIKRSPADAAPAEDAEGAA